MRFIWTLVKVIIGLAIAIPLAIFLFATTLGVLGAMIALAFVALKLAIVALAGLFVFRLAARVLGSKRTPAPPRVKALPPVDPHYEAAMRELDAELGSR